MNFINSLHAKAILPLLVIYSMAHAADPVVTNISALQRVGTKLVDISYNVTADTPTVQIYLEISNDGGQTFTVPAVSTSGAVGAGVPTGTGKTIIWDAGVDWNGRNSSQLRFKVIADDLLPDLTDFTEFALIPAGNFTMGDSLIDGYVDDLPEVTVNVSAFLMAKNEVTMALWNEVRTWGASNGYTDIAVGAVKEANHPAQKISWWDVVKWSNARSQKEGLTPVYTVSGAVMRTGTTEPSADWSANGYRLPTEAEWEKAARGGLSGQRFPWGDTISFSQANYYANLALPYDLSGIQNNYHNRYRSGAAYTSPVRTFLANGYGLHDMAGNVFEWCWDWYGEAGSSYRDGATDPRGANSGTARVIRGGSWGYDARYCRVAERRVSGFGTFAPSHNSGHVGFRIARSCRVARSSVP
jgi:formylglycine-generating enzyme required for sulfatase activity